MDRDAMRQRVIKAMERFEAKTTDEDREEAWEEYRRSKKPKRSKELKCGCLRESEEQKAFLKESRKLGFKWFWTMAEDPGLKKSDVAILGWRRSMGLRNGIPDLISISHAGLAMEMKARCSRHTLSDKQKDRRAELQVGGWTVLVGKGCDGAMAELRAWIRGRAEKRSLGGSGGRELKKF